MDPIEQHPDDLAALQRAFALLESPSIVAKLTNIVGKPLESALDKLPDSAGARVPVVAALFSVSIPTVWRWTRDQRLPAPKRHGGVTLWNVGLLRKFMAESKAKANDGARTASATAAAAAKRRTASAV